VGSPTAYGQLLGPTAYLSEANSPFNGLSFTYFHRETFEDNVLNTPGVSVSAGNPFGPGGPTDSVDADDGTIDGSGANGRSLFSDNGAQGITFTFNAAVLGTLPTHVGIVWTDGGDLLPTRFEAFDAGGVSLGSLTGNHSDASFLGTTAEDRFYGVQNQGGVSRIFISNTAGGIEVDHLQYGQIVPEPASLTLMGIGVVAVVYSFRRRRMK
jgi:hypothetical protein